MVGGDLMTMVGWPGVALVIDVLRGTVGTITGVASRVSPVTIVGMSRFFVVICAPWIVVATSVPAVGMTVPVTVPTAVTLAAAVDVARPMTATT
jgi:hypothetical protein